MKIGHIIDSKLNPLEEEVEEGLPSFKPLQELVIPPIIVWDNLLHPLNLNPLQDSSLVV